MKKLLVPLAVFLLLALAVPAAFAAPSQLELGMSWTPYTDINSGALDYITGFHVGYAWYIFYGSWDALALPASYVSNYSVYNEPAFLNLVDGGIRLVLGPVVGSAAFGTNFLHVYNIPGIIPSVGANVKVGLGLKFRWWGVGAYLIRPYATWDEMGSDVASLFSSDGTIRTAAVDSIFDWSKLVPGFNLTFYF